MRGQLNMHSTAKPKVAQSQSPLNKKRIYKFVQDSTNSKAEKSMQAQLHPAKPSVQSKSAEKTDFKIEIERRFQMAHATTNYRFPTADEPSSEDLSSSSRTSSQDSLERLKTTTTYDLHSQNLRYFAKLQKRKQLTRASINQEVVISSSNDSNVLKTQRDTAYEAAKTRSSQKSKPSQQKKEVGGKPIPKIRKIIDLNPKEQSSNQTFREATESRSTLHRKSQNNTQERVCLDRSTPDTADTMTRARTGTKKTATGLSPKKINFSLNINAGQDQLIEKKLTPTGANSQRTLQSFTAMSKSTKELAKGLYQTSSTSNLKLEQQQQHTSTSKNATASSTLNGQQFLPKSSTSSSSNRLTVSNYSTALKKTSGVLKSTASNLSNLSSDKSQLSSLRSSEIEKYFTSKSPNPSKSPNSKSFVSIRNAEESSPAAQSREALKKTNILYNKAHNDLVKKFQHANTTQIPKPAASKPHATFDIPKEQATVNIHRFLQGSLTTKSSTSKTPTRISASPRINGDSLGHQSTSSSASHLKNSNLTAPFTDIKQTNKKSATKAGQGPVAGISLSHLQKLIEKKSCGNIKRPDLVRQQSPSSQNTPGTTSAKTLITRALGPKVHLHLDLHNTHHYRGGALSDRNLHSSKGSRPFLTERSEISLNGAGL